MKTMLISVGGAEAPIVSSVKSHLPDKIIFFVSKASREQVSAKIMPAIFDGIGKMIDHEFIVTPDEADIGESTKILLDEVPRAMRKLGQDAQWPGLADYTGGTKTMSAAVVWASSMFPCLFNYVGGTERGKNGLGVVLDGSERHVTLQNPWDKLAYFEIQHAMRLFDCAQYANSAELFAKTEGKVTDEKAKRSLSLLAAIVRAYHEWDIFNHKTALSLFSKNFDRLKDFPMSDNPFLPDLSEFTESVEKNYGALKKFDTEPFFLVHDLLSNARRRADLEIKFEDATARTYSAIERTAKIALKKYGIDNSKCDPGCIPETIRQEYILKYSREDTLLHFGCHASFHLLLNLNDDMGKRFSENTRINAHLAERNNSILAHGTHSIDRPKFENLFDDALNLLAISRSDLPVFPSFFKPKGQGQ